MRRRTCALLLCVLAHAQDARAEELGRPDHPPSTRAVIAAARAAGPRSAPELELSRAKLAYERGDYSAAIAALRPLLYPEVLLPEEEQVVLAHKLLGLSAFFERDEATAEQEFNLLLGLRPDFALDPLVEPLKAVAFVDGLRRRNAERLAEIRRRQEDEAARREAAAREAARRAEELRRAQAPRVYIERVVTRRLSALHFVPFGVPQLVEGRRALGVALCVTEGVLGAASIGTWLAVLLRYPDGRYPAAEAAAANGLTYTYIVSGGLFWGLVGAGLIEALVRAKTEVTLRELPGPPRELLRSAPPQGRKKAALRLLPMPPAPDAGLAVGLVLGGIF